MESACTKILWILIIVEVSYSCWLMQNYIQIYLEINFTSSETFLEEESCMKRLNKWSKEKKDQSYSVFLFLDCEQTYESEVAGTFLPKITLSIINCLVKYCYNCYVSTLQTQRCNWLSHSVSVVPQADGRRLWPASWLATYLLIAVKQTEQLDVCKLCPS